MFGKSFKKTLVASAAAGLTTLMLAGTAHALPSVEDLFTIGTDIWSDDSVELFLDVGTGDGQEIGNGLLDTGDILIGLFNITSYSSGGNVATHKQLTGIFATKVVSSSVLITAGANPTQGIEISSYVFGPTSPGDAFDWTTGLTAAASAALGGLTIGAFGPGTSGDTMALFFEDDGTIVNSLTSLSLQDAFDQSTDGALQLVVDLIGANGDAFTGSGPTDVSDIGLLPVNTQIDFATFNFNGTIAASGFGSILVGSDIHTRNSTLSRGPSGSFFPISDQTEFVLQVSDIPEPASLALFGLGLLGLGAMGRRRRKV